MNIWPEQHILEVADGIFAVMHSTGETGLSNATFVIENQRALVVDTMLFPEMADIMAREITRHAASVDCVLNTHHHLDHVGGNKRFADARIIAHPRSVEILRHTAVPVKMFDTMMPAFRGRFAGLEVIVPQPGLADFVPPHAGKLLAFPTAHTPMDVALWFPDTQVLIAGDLSFIGVTPLAIHGLLSGWIEALNTLITLQPRVVVPGHGRVGDARDLLTLCNYLQAVLKMGYFAVQEGLSLQEALEQFEPGPTGEWLEPVRTRLNLERAMQEARQEISRNDLSASLPSLLQAHQQPPDAWANTTRNQSSNVDIYVHYQCSIHQQKAYDFENFYRNELIPHLRKVPGFLDETLLRHTTRQESYLIISHWSCRQLFEDWRNNAAHQSIVRTFPALFASKPQISLYSSPTC